MSDDVTVKVYFPWWFRWFYLPVTRLGLWLGLPLNEDVIAADVEQAVRIKAVKQ